LEYEEIRATLLPNEELVQVRQGFCAVTKDDLAEVSVLVPALVLALSV
jgi:hypothetical protein